MFVNSSGLPPTNPHGKEFSMKKLLILTLLLASLGSAHGLVGFGESNIFTIIVPTLPVELSSFTAAVTVQNFVSVNWTSQTETGLVGYRIYRAQAAELAGAQLLTPVCIPATNSSQPHSYSHVDQEVELGRTYHYWLESADYCGSNFYGPASVTVEPASAPPLPEVTLMRDPWPNPFRACANLEIEVKADETAVLGIYNLAGQLVSTESFSPGYHKLAWDGRDSRGRPCSSGIYLLRLVSPSRVCSNKLVLLK